MEYTGSTQKLLTQYDLEANDLMYCTLMRAGWGKFEAIYHAYHLQWFDLAKLNLFLRERLKSRPGILTLQSDWNAEDKAAAKELKDMKEKLKAKKKTAKSGDGNPETMSKEDLDKMYIDIMHDPNADSKTRLDASKSYIAIHPDLKNDQVDTNDDVNFFLPASCHYCDRCRNCELKGELEKRGCTIKAKRTSPFLWEIASTEDAKQIIGNEQ